ncbi:MAG: methyltransferase domain-containing protein [Pseudolabrys sp.]|nr:methyltransferase domain-containing protein [Pseudolabrys sp.]
MAVLDEAKNRLIVLSGAVLLAALGRQRFYRLTQSGTPILSKISAYFCKGHVARLIHDFEVQTEGKDKNRISAAALRLYSDDSLAGYGDAEFSKTDGKPLRGQQRGLIIPLVEAEIRHFEQKHGRSPKVLEIGVANGDVLVDIAEHFPAASFVGVDLSVANAKQKYTKPNVEFVKGYTLDLIEQDAACMHADIVFGTSTFCAMVPNEFRRHVAFFAAKGFQSVVISDPITGGYMPMNDASDISKHMSHYMWFHNYAGYLRNAGYQVPHFNVRNFVYSWNPRATVALVVGRRNNSN